MPVPAPVPVLPNTSDSKGQGGQGEIKVEPDVSEKPLERNPTISAPTLLIDKDGMVIDKANIFTSYFQRQLSLLFLLFVCVCLLVLWRRISSKKRSKARAAKNRYNRLRQIV